MRLDKYLSDSGIGTRKETAKACARGEISVNGLPVRRADTAVNPDTDVIAVRGTVIPYTPFVYILLNKPQGYISATEDGKAPVVTELLPPEIRRRGVFPCGRLDKDTVGLMLLTDDGPLAHDLLSPKKHVSKTYGFTLSRPLPTGAEERFARGVVLGEEICKSASLFLDEGRQSGSIVLVEGKYHQIKRMMHTEGSEILTLERLTFGPLSLDFAMPRGTWRYLSKEEVQELKKAPGGAVHE